MRLVLCSACSSVRTNRGCTTEPVGVLQARHYSPRTQKSYLGWIKRFLAYFDGRHPRELNEDDVNAFLTHLAVDREVAASTQSQALAAILFLFRHVLEAPLQRIEGIVRAKKPKRLPTVLTAEQVAAVLAELDGVPRLVAMVQYGSGLRLMEALTLRVKDVNFGLGEIVVRGGKGDKDRLTMLPDALRRPLVAHLEDVRAMHQQDLAVGLGRVPMPGALSRKWPKADRDWSWQWVFPATSHFTDRESGVRHRWHFHESAVQRAVKIAADAAGLGIRVTTHTFRHSFATQLLQDGLRHPDGAGVVGPPRRPHDGDLHPRSQPRRPWRPQSTRRAQRRGPGAVIQNHAKGRFR